MKKHAIALAALGLVSGVASAQSSVTLYGVVDVALERVKGATSLTRVTSGQQQGSRWGLRGTEDLGGGMKATFLLESGFNADVGTLGQGGRLFGRQGYVGLGGGWGTVRLGRQYTPMDDIAGIIGTKVYDVVSVVPIIGNGDYNRVDNAITYVSPTISNTVFQLQYSLGDERVSTNPSADFGKQVSGHALYAQGPWTLGLSLMQVADADGVVILSFPSMPEAKAWYDSPAYTEAKKHRFQAADYRVIFVGDASMSPYEITMPGGSVEHWNEEAGAVWMKRARQQWEKSVWLNPVQERYWDYTASVGMLREVMEQQMFPLTLEGLAQSNARVSSYMRNLEDSGWMSNPDLTIIETKGEDKGLPNMFSLKVTLKNPSSAEDEAAAGGAQ